MISCQDYHLLHFTLSYSNVCKSTGILACGLSLDNLPFLTRLYRLPYNFLLRKSFFDKWCCKTYSSVQFSSVTQSCPTLCNPMDCSRLGLPVHHQLPEFTQTHVHWVSDAIQPSHPLSSPFPTIFNLSQNQGLFKWVSSSHPVAKAWEFQL